MRPRQDLPASLTRLCLVQSDVVSAHQCAEAGFRRSAKRRLLDARLWRSLADGIYYTQPGEPPWEAFACAAVLLGGEQSRLSGLSAATVHRLHDGRDLPIEVLAPTHRRAQVNWARFIQEGTAGRGSSARSFPPCLNAVDTVLDLCARGSAEQVVSWITTAVQRRLVTPKELARGLDQRIRLRNRTFIGAVIGDAQSGVHSNLELRYLSGVERAHGLPTAERQFVVPDTGRHADAAYVAQRVLVELDGRVGHESSEGRFRDRNRDNAHSLAGWITLRFGWTDVAGDPCAVAGQVARVLRHCGWTGFPERCARCRSSA